MEKFILKSVFFKQLKCLNDVEVYFSDTLTAIMGVNGSGKTTVIHALACIYRPDGNGENHKFPEFFVPNTDSLWRGSEFHIVNVTENANRERIVLPSKKYSKDYDRWAPRYDSRPKRNVYYIGIDTCLPDIEKNTTTSRIVYRTQPLSDRISKKAKELAAYILNKNYDSLLENTYKKKHFLGVELKSGLKYSSLSMGSGEQRVIKIIDVLLNAEPYSMILIDEIDLLLHISALHKLVKIIYDKAREKHIQVVFTTHSLEMMSLSQYVKIQYISNCSEERSSLVYDKITSDMIYSMTGLTKKTHHIFVEDALAKSIVAELVRKKDMSSMVDVVTYGAIENAFTLASSFVIRDESLDNKLIVLDGDRYVTNEDKEGQIKKKLTGTESAAEEKRTRALSVIKQFYLPDGIAPEEFLHETIKRCFPKDSEIYIAAEEIKAVKDSHEWINNICEKLGLDTNSIIHDIYKYAKDDVEFNKYIKNVNDWLDAQCN